MTDNLKPARFYRLPWSLTDNAISWLEPTAACNMYCEGCYRKNDPKGHKSLERIKEELRTGRTLGAAIEAGFNRAWTAIRDSNVTTFIVCGILYWLGSSIVASAPVMGFAVTLFIGVAVSMFTAIVVTRTLLRLFVGSPLAKRTTLFSVHFRKE